LEVIYELPIHQHLGEKGNWQGTLAMTYLDTKIH